MARQLALIVEDDGYLALSAEFLLERMGYHTLVAPSAEKALEILRHDRHPRREISVLLVDIRLGDDATAGLTVALEAVTMKPDLKVLYTTGYGVNGEMRRAFVRSSGFLSKPYTPGQLRIAIRNLAP